MSNITMLHQLFRHMEWADARVWTSLFSTPAAHNDSVLRDRLSHIHVVQWGFLHLWLDRPLPEFPAQSKFPDLNALASWGRQAHEEIAGYTGRITEPALERVITLPFADYFEKQFGKANAPVTLAQTMLQVASHSSHHRGQVNTRLREIGAEPPFVDLIVWAWLGMPVANWPSILRDAAAVAESKN
jgi:uncharacterized damage-inducible protein DinB